MSDAALPGLRAGLLRRAARYHRSKPFRMCQEAPLVSFTFDDVPDSAFTNGAPVLESRGLRGTFYVASGTCSQPDTYWRLIDPEQVRALHAQGHEIGCHTFSHVAVERLSAAALDEECRRNEARLRELCPGIALTNFCYPFGRASLPRKLQLMRRFDTCRGIYEGINRGTVDLAMLRVIELYDSTLTPEKLRRALSETRDSNGWLIFYTHDVAAQPSRIGCTPQFLATVIEATKAAGLRCLTVRDALAAIGYKSPANSGEERKTKAWAAPGSARA